MPDIRIADPPQHTEDTRDTRTPRIDPVELNWRGTQAWICSLAACWPQAPGWYLIDWGDGSTDVAHPDLEARRHSYACNSVCCNTTHTITVRQLHRDGTTGPVEAESQVSTRGWGAPQHRFDLAADGRTVHASLFRTETPLGYSLCWDTGMGLEWLPDGTTTASHTYPAGDSRQVTIGVLDRPARRLRWFAGPTINAPNRKAAPMGKFNAHFTPSSEWNGGYSASYRITHETLPGAEPSTWEMSFTLDEPAVLADVWGGGVAKTSGAKRSKDSHKYKTNSEPELVAVTAVPATPTPTPDPLVMTVEPTTGTTTTEFLATVDNDGQGDVDVDWGDGTAMDTNPGDGTTSTGHTYATADTYTITATSVSDEARSDTADVTVS